MSSALLRRLDRLIARRNTTDPALLAAINEDRTNAARYFGLELKPLDPETVKNWPRTPEQWEVARTEAWAKLGMVRP